MPITHAGLTVSDLPDATVFYLKALQPLGYRYIGRWGPQIGFGHKEPEFFLTQEMPGMNAGGSHIAFAAPSRAAVHEFFASAIEAGGRAHGKPAQRYDGDDCFNAAILDFDGNSIEVVFHEVGEIERSGGPDGISCVTSCGRRRLTEKTDTFMPTKQQASQDNASQINSVFEVCAERQALALHNSSLLPNGFVRRDESTAKVLSELHRTINANSSTTESSLTAKTLAGTLLGAAAGAVVAYAMCRSEEDSARAEVDASIAASRNLKTGQDQLYLTGPATPSHTPASSHYGRESRLQASHNQLSNPQSCSFRFNPVTRAIEYIPEPASGKPSQVIPDHFNGPKSTLTPSQQSSIASHKILRGNPGHRDRMSSDSTNIKYTHSSAQSELPCQAATTQYVSAKAAVSTAASARDIYRSADSAPAAVSSSGRSSRSSHMSRKTHRSNPSGSETAKPRNSSQPRLEASLVQSSTEVDKRSRKTSSLLGESRNNLQNIEDESDSIVPSDSISCVGSSKSKRSKRSSRRTSGSITSSKLSQISKKSGSRDRNQRYQVEQSHTSSDQESINPKGLKERSVMSLPVRGLTPSIVGGINPRSIKSSFG